MQTMKGAAGGSSSNQSFEASWEIAMAMLKSVVKSIPIVLGFQ